MVKRTIKEYAPSVVLKRILHKRDWLNRGPAPIQATGTLVDPFVPPGHFHSPIPSADEIRQREERIFNVPDEIPAIDLNTDEQLRTLAAFAEYYKELPFRAEKTRGLRYWFKNPMYSYSDGICLYSMMRHLRPKRIIEVGAGYSSCAMLDTNELFFDNSISLTIIEPHPQAFLSLLKRGDAKRIELLTSQLQDVGLNEFSRLSANDILFVDSSHVSKVGSDVNYLIFEILPLLQRGVYVHFHDIFYPFEYPKHWICDLGIAWTEAYLLRSFLQYNTSFRIAFFNTYLEDLFEKEVREAMPLCFNNKGGSIWLRKEVAELKGVRPTQSATKLSSLISRGASSLESSPTRFMSRDLANCALPASGRFESLKPARGYFRSFEGPGEGFHVGGWMCAPAPVQFSAFALYLNRELVGVADPGIAPKIYDKVRHLGEPQLFEFHLPRTKQEIPNFTRVEVLGCVGDQPERRLATLLRWDMETDVPTPPEKLMFRVTGNTDGGLVKGAGLRCASEFLDVISLHRDLSTLRNLLDWGCGCGRVTVHLIDFLSKYDGLQTHGCDIDGEAIEWCKENLPRGRFRHINPFPPLPWSEASFDVVVSCSVFTHLSEEVQQRWLDEMRRIIAPGGLFLASVKSDPQVPDRGISDDTMDVMLDGIAPAGYYRGTVQSREYTISRWSDYFDVLDFIENGLEGSQDLVVMRRPDRA